MEYLETNSMKIDFDQCTHFLSLTLTLLFFPFIKLNSHNVHHNYDLRNNNNSKTVKTVKTFIKIWHYYPSMYYTHIQTPPPKNKQIIFIIHFRIKSRHISIVFKLKQKIKLSKKNKTNQFKNTWSINPI